jgi:hypothetical protein
VTAAPVCLEWGVRTSLLAYVEALPDGCVQAGDGAIRRGEVFAIPGRPTGADVFAFDGTVHFAGHHGVLDVTLTAFRLHRTGETAELFADIAGELTRIAELAGVRTDDGALLHSGMVTLTDDGAAVLGGVYSPGTPLAPITVRSAS